MLEPAQIKNDSKVKISFTEAVKEAMEKDAPNYGDNPEDTIQINDGIDYYLRTH